MGYKIGVVGSGFAKSFIPLFQAHPLVEEVVLAELITERRNDTAARFGIKRSFSSHDELCKSDVDAIAIFTQRHLHGPQTLQALRAGKHVYCAVPIASSIEDISAIIDEVKKSGLLYMTGETSYYYPSTIYCRERFQNGDFGHFVYGEAQYIHDMTHGFYDAFQRSGGADWKQVAGIPPMYYCTHSVSMILSTTGSQATSVSCLGYKDRHEDEIFTEGGNLWGNPFSNETALIRTSDGGTCRINEFRRAGWSGRNSVYLSMFGTLGTYEEHGGGSIWTTINRGELEDVSEALRCQNVKVEDHHDELHEALKEDYYKGVSSVHPIERLPKTFIGKPNGHFGSHQFLVDDFVKSLHSRTLPPNHVWNAARYCIPGLIAHESALKDGETMKIPDLGDPPSHLPLLDPDQVMITE